MPANLTPNYHAAEERYKRAGSPEEQLEALQEMLRVIPKHKGTDRLQGELRKKISRLRQSLNKKSKNKSGKGRSIYVRKEGIGQFILVGAPNSGKSSILGALTNAEPEVAPYQFTTREAQPAMAFFDNVQIQLVDIPPVSDYYMENWVPSLIRYADGVLLTAFMGNPDFPGDVDDVIRILGEKNIKLVNDCEEGDNSGKIALKRTLLVATGMDLPVAEEHLKICREFFGEEFRVVPFSAIDETTYEPFLRILFDFMKVIRIYTRAPGKKANRNLPFVLPVGSTVEDLAWAVHKELGEKVSHAKVWGSSKFPGQSVPREYVLRDEDEVEIEI